MTIVEAFAVISSYQVISDLRNEVDTEMVRLQKDLFHKGEDFSRLKKLTKEAQNLILEKVFDLGVNENENKVKQAVLEFVKNDFDEWGIEDFKINNQPFNI